MKRILSLLLLLALLVSLSALSPAALADEPEETPAPEATPEPTVLTKLTVTLDRTPVVLLSNSECHGTVSSRNASFVSLTWYDAEGSQMAAGAAFEFQRYRAEIRAQADDGYVFSPTLNGYLNNSAATVVVSGDGKYATVSREYDALVYAPRIIKQPGAEEVEEGSFVSYVSTAAYTLSLTWEFTSPDGEKTVELKDIIRTFPNSGFSNDGKEKIVISNVTREMNGWKVRAVFSGAQDTVTRSNPVEIKVKFDPNTESPDPVETPEPEPTPEPEATPEPTEAPVETPEPTEAPVETPEPTETPAPAETPVPTERPAETPVVDSEHEHRFSLQWYADAEGHWHQCDCGEIADEGAHDMVWTTVKLTDGISQQEGVCKVCGYRTSQQVPVTRSPINMVPAGIVLIAGLGLIVVLVTAESVSRSRRREE